MGVERFFERFVDTAAVKAHRLSVIGQQSNQDDISEVVILSQVLADLHCFDLADRKVDDDTIRIEAFRLDAGFETAGGNFYLERFFRRKFTLQVFDQALDLGRRSGILPSLRLPSLQVACHAP